MQSFKTHKHWIYLFILMIGLALSGCGGEAGGGSWFKPTPPPTTPIMTEFSFIGFPGAPGAINEPEKTISVTLPFGTNVTALVANFTTNATNVAVGSVTQSNGVTANNFTNPVAYTLTAADKLTATYTVQVFLAPSYVKTITAFSFVGHPGSPGTINETTKSIAVTLPVATPVTALVANFSTVAPSVKIGAAVQTSGALPGNNFTTPLTYRVTAADGTFADYVVTVTVTPPVLSSLKTITAFSFVGFPGYPGTINEAAKTIAVNLPAATPITALVANFTTVAPSVKIGAAVQTSGALPGNNFTAPVTYRVTAADGTFADYVVTVTVTPPALSSLKTITAFSFVGYPGSPGTVNEAAKTIAVTLPVATPVTALVANFTTVAPSVKIGAAVQTSGALPGNNFTAPVTYRVTAADGTFADYVVTVTVTPPALSSLKTITAFSFVGYPGSPGTVNEAAKTIAVTLPVATPVTALVANFTTVAPSVKIGAAVQTSGALPGNNFTTPLTYRVTAADGSFVDYVVTVTVTPPVLSSLKTITAFSFVGFPGYPGTVNEAAKTIVVTLPVATPVTALVANFTTVAPSVKIGAAVQTSGALPGNNFTTPLTYRVTAADSSFVDYVVTVTVTPPALSSLKTITAFSFVGYPGSPGTVNEAAKTIAVTLPVATPVTALVANFTTVAPSVKIGAAVQTSGALPGNNFTAPVTYRVTAADGSFADYVVTVTVTPPALSSLKTITAFSFVGFPGYPGTVNEAAKTIAVTLPVATPVTALVANFTTVAPSVKIGAAVQTSGALPGNNFTAPVTYRVTAADGSFVDYVVTVTVTPPALSSLKTITAFSFVGFPGDPGTINEAAKTISVILPIGTPVTALVANFTTVAPSVKIGAAVQTSGALPGNDFTTPVTYRVTAADSSFVDYVVTVTVPPPVLSSLKTITAFSFVGYPGSPGTINEAAKTIAVTLPVATPVTALVANFTTVAPSVKIGAAVQTSGALPGNNFTAPVTYRVTAADSSFADYVVTVTVTPPVLSSLKSITAFSFVGFPGSPGIINEAAKTIAVTLPVATPVTALVANFTTVAPSVKIGAAVQTSGALPGNNFTAPVTYRVTAADSSFVDYIVTVTIAQSSAKAITAYSFVGVPDSTGLINQVTRTIAVTMRPGTPVTALTANYATTGTGVKIGVAIQTSGGAPANDFTAPVTYRVTAADGSTADYVVTVSFGVGPAPVNLGTAADFAILTKTGITTTGVTTITGDIGVSPIAATAMTGFSLAMDSTNTFSTSPLVTGKVYAANYTAPTPTKMTTAISDLRTAYLDAAGRATPDATELYAGNLSGQTIPPGLYKWSTGISVNAASTVTLSGGPNDVWIFQISGDITMNPGASVTLLGGAQAKNIFWQVGGPTGVTLDTSTAFKGILLVTKAIVFKNGASLVNGRALAETNVTMIGTTITAP